MKTRMGYVSNSSSSSFLLDNFELGKVFQDAGINVKIYSCRKVKEIMASSMKYLFHAMLADPDYQYDLYDFWDEYLSGKVPDWFQYECPIDDFKENIEFLRTLKDEQYITDKIDRDKIYDAFGDSSNIGVEGINFLRGDL